MITQEPDYLTDVDRLVYQAEEEATMEFFDLEHDYPDRVEPENIEGFIRSALQGAGWTGGELPEIRLDIPDEDWRSGRFRRGPDGEWFSFHPKILCPFSILHEVAHWCANAGDHGPKFRGAHLGLLRAGIGEMAAECFARWYTEAGLDWDRDLAH